MSNKSFSGIYPHLAVTNDVNSECGIGAVVLYAGRLYWITYPASAPKGGGGKLYSTDGSLKLFEHPESVGGTHANRHIHAATGKLVIGAHVIAPDGTVKSFDVAKLFGRITGTGDSLNNPGEWVYINTMEDGFYEANVNTLEVRCLRRDMIWEMANRESRLAAAKEKLFGDHGKGGYTAQGVFIRSNNAHMGVLAEWNGKGDAQKRESWRVIDRNKYTEVTGPGGIHGPNSSTDPVWALGWDDKSVLMNVRCGGQWTRMRLPKASYTQDSDNGWYTEWPRIRSSAPGRHLMCMHGMFYDFPGQFTPLQKNGVRPLCRHLKMISDWEWFQDRLVFACNDATPFDNPQVGRQSSNLWFSSYENLCTLSEPLGFGGVWAHENVYCDEPSEPFYVGGFDVRTLHIVNGDSSGAGFRVECDKNGRGVWVPCMTVNASANNGYRQISLVLPEGAEWVRIVPEKDASSCSAFFHLRMAADVSVDESLRYGLQPAEGGGRFFGGRLRAVEGEDLRLRYFAKDCGAETDGAVRTYEIGVDMVLQAVKTPDPMPDTEAGPSYTPVIRDTGHSYAIIAPGGGTYHVAKNESCFDELDSRLVREVVTERAMLLLGGTFFELPWPSSGGVSKLKPVATPCMRITDFCSWRGMLVMTGVGETGDGPHIIRAADGTGLWFGNVDDLWRMGAPRGTGGPIKDKFLYKNQASEPFLLFGYRNIKLALEHGSCATVYFTVDVDFAGDGSFAAWSSIEAPAGVQTTFDFPDGFSAHWVRVRPDADCRASATFTLA